MIDLRWARWQNSDGTPCIILPWLKDIPISHAVFRTPSLCLFFTTEEMQVLRH